jgi:hypothetical protein
MPRAMGSHLVLSSMSPLGWGSALMLRNDDSGREDSLRFGLSPAAVRRSAHRTHLLV